METIDFIVIRNFYPVRLSRKNDPRAYYSILTKADDPNEFCATFPFPDNLKDLAASIQEEIRKPHSFAYFPFTDRINLPEPFRSYRVEEMLCSEKKEFDAEVRKLLSGK